MKNLLQLSILTICLLANSITNAQWSTAAFSSGSGRGFLAAAAGNNIAIFAGGIGMISQPPGIYDQYNGNTNSWTSGNFSPARCELAGASAGNWLLFAGGANDWILSTYDNVNIYNAGNGTWQTSNALSVPRTFLAGASAGNKIAFGGGEDNFGQTYFNTVDIFDINTQTWNTSTLSVARSKVAAAGAGNKIVFAGGEDAASVYDVVDIYDVSNGTWSTATLSLARKGLSATSNGNKIYIAGGLTATNQVSNRIDIYDVSTNTWSIDSVPVSRQKMSAGSLGNYVIFAGGSNANNSSAFNNVDILDVTSGSWTTATLNTARYSGASASTNNKFLLGGGLNSAGLPQNTVEVFTLTSTGLQTSKPEESFQVSPNPSSGLFTLHFDEKVSVSSITIMDITGQTILKIIPGGSETILDLSKNPDGIYYLNIQKHDGSTCTRKMIKN